MSATESRVWLERAESNLRLAQRGKGEGVFLEDLCFEAQQTTEKALKALLIEWSDDFPKVHSIGLLLERLEIYACPKLNQGSGRAYGLRCPVAISWALCSGQRRRISTRD